MLSLARYLKKYLAPILVAVLLLFGQALFDLSLPTRMSDIVNTGIQKGGISDVAPQALEEDMLTFFLYFTSDADKKILTDSYVAYSTLESKEQAKIDKTFPDAKSKNAYVLSAKDDALTAANGAFSRAGMAFVNFLTANSDVSATEANENEQLGADFDLDKLKELLPMLPMMAQMKPELFDEAIESAAKSPEMMGESVIALLNRGFYRQLGADTDKMQTNYIAKTGGIMLLISLLNGICAIGAGYCFAVVGSSVARDVHRDMYAKVSGFTNAEFDKFSTSSLITRTTNDVTQVQMMYTMGMRMIVFAPILGIGGIIMALQKSVNMSWIIAVAVLAMLCVVGVMFAAVMPRIKKMQKLVDRLSMVTRENLSGIMVVRAFSNQKFQEGRFENANTDLTGNSKFVGRVSAMMMPVMMMLMNLVSLVIIWVSSQQIAASALQVGDMMAFMQYAMQIIMAFLFIAMIFIMMPRAAVSAERINEVLNSESSIKDPQNPVSFDKNPKGVVEFKDVSFRYGGASEDVLSNLSFIAMPGQTTAFIGSTGSGKSTLINLLPRFYDATEGSITIDGVDIRKVRQKDLRDVIGFVPQKGLLFSGTIESNLRYGNQDASAQVLQEAADVAQATEFIDSTDKGMQTEISQGGTNVSGGQRQRIAIARALVKKTPIYIFDDSFSALDFATDARLRTALKPYTKTSTVLLVAQRVASIMHAEQIVVLDEGKVVGIGTHTELLESCPTYSEIAQSQLSKEELQ